MCAAEWFERAEKQSRISFRAVFVLVRATSERTRGPAHRSPRAGKPSARVAVVGLGHAAMAPHGATSDAHPPVARAFVFDDRLGRGEGAEHEKLLGVFPSSTARDECAAAVGLAQGLTGFLAPFADARAETPRRATSFGASSATETSTEPTPTRVAEPRSLVLAADARRVACLECEPHIWWLLSVDARAAPERDVRDAALLRMLSDAHEDYALVHGTLQSVLSDETRSNAVDSGAYDQTVKEGGGGGVDGARRRLAPFVAALGANVANAADDSIDVSIREESVRIPFGDTRTRTPARSLTHAITAEPVALAAPDEPSAFAPSPAARARASASASASEEEEEEEEESPRRVASRSLDAVASALTRRGASVAASAAVYHAADGKCRVALASSRAVARYANRCFAPEAIGAALDVDGERTEKRNGFAARVRGEAASALEALRAFASATTSGDDSGDDSGDASNTRDASRDTDDAAKKTDEEKETKTSADDCGVVRSPPDATPAFWGEHAPEADGRFFFADRDAGRGVAAFQVRGDDRGDAATLVCFFTFTRAMDATNIANDETRTEERAALLARLRGAADTETAATARAVADGAFQPHALVPDIGRGGCGGIARDATDANHKSLSRSTLRAVTATRAELDALRRDPDADEFPSEACYRASHDAWVAVRGAAFLKNTEHKAAGAFVVSAAEGSGGTLLEASARADACLREAAY
jgi:hypothetical protein